MKKEDAEELLIGSIKPDSDQELEMFLDSDPFFTWSGFEGYPENPIFSHGEVLEYEVSWMGINAGSVTMRLDTDTTHESQPVYRAIVTGKTTKGFSLFFKVHDVITSYFERDSFNSRKYIKDVREGHYRKLKETSYDQPARKAHVKDQEFDIPPNSKDPIACFYAMRRFEVQAGKSVRFNSNSEGKSNIPVEIGFTETREIKLADDVKRMAIKGEPLPIWVGRDSKNKKSQVLMWLSADKYAVPLKLESKVRIGTMKAKLVMRKGPGWEINLKKDK